MKKRIFLRGMILLPIALSLLLGCSGKRKEIKTIQGDPELLYKQGLDRFNKRDYPEALKKFEELKSSFPDNPPYTVWAELKVGDCHFLEGKYVEAIAAYEEFKKIHPGHEEIPYVQFQIAMSYFNQMYTLDRDQTPTKKALSSFEYLIANYPPSLFTEKAKEKVGVCKKRLADHEFYIGNFYYKKEKFQAAATRFEGLLEKFPKNPDEDKTLHFLGKSYLELEQWEKAEAAFRRIVTEYPKSPYAQEAKAMVDRGLAEKKVSLRKTKESEKKDEGTGVELDQIALAKFVEERRQLVSLKERKRSEMGKEEEKLASLSVASESVKAIPPNEEARKPVSPVGIGPIQEDRAQAVPTSKEAGKGKPIPAGGPMEEDRIAPSPPSDTAPPKVEMKPVEEKPVGEKQIAALPSSPTPSKEKQSVKKGILLGTKEAKLVDKSQPIDITSDKVEAIRKENLIIFRGNVVARQKDIVIYADSLEALTSEDGKGIERVTAGGNVKIQQGLRVANCEKAIFYNLDQKVILTGAPRVSEGENIVSGDEIIFDIDKDRVEVRGGPSGRGKAKIRPGEIEKLK
jgi:outer membrane protein assembly factor BamD